MRISYQTLLMVLVCFVGGLAVYMTVGIKYQVLENLQSENSNSAVLVRDVEHLEAGLSQWFVNLDLFFSQQEGYLAKGIKTQSKQLKLIVDSIQSRIALVNDQQDLFNGFSDSLIDVAEIVISASVINEVGGDDWNRALNDADEISFSLVEKMDQIIAKAKTHAGIIKIRLEQEKKTFYRLVVICLLTYIIIIFAVWYWATVNLVRPLETLTMRAKEDTDDENVEFELERGPQEVMELSASINQYVIKLKQQKKSAEKARQIATMANERTNAIMDTAPNVIITTDENGLIETVNTRIRDFFFYEISDVINKDISVLIPGFHIENISKGITQETMQYDTYKGYQKLGIQFPIEISISPRQESNKWKYTLVIQDITQRKVREKEVKKLNEQLIDASREAGISEIAASILHNVGNVLNAVNTSVTMLSENVRKSRVQGLSKACKLLGEHKPYLADYLINDPKGKKVIEYLEVLAGQLNQEQIANTEEIDDLDKNLKHIKMIISSQQKYAFHTGVLEEIIWEDIIDNCLKMNASSIDNHDIQIVKNYQFGINPIEGDRHKIMQIIVNLIKNAKDALIEANIDDPTITLSLSQTKNSLQVEVKDNGVGISQKNQEKLFTFGFTTKRDGHGFGLHSCSLEAKNLGGKLIAHSDGEGQGTTFIFEHPLGEHEKGQEMEYETV